MDWPDSVATPLILSCADCGNHSKFDYMVDDDFWREFSGDERLNILCLPCLDKRCSGQGLAAALIKVQWTGTNHTVVLSVVLRHEY